MLSIRPAYDTDMFTVLHIRNSGRLFMTHHTDEISAAEQIEWWQSPARQQAHIWIAEIDNEPVGFCMIRTMYDSGRDYGTLAVLPEYQGQGVGTALYRFMITQTDELWIDVRIDNAASLSAAIKAGFQLYHHGISTVTLVARS